MRIPGNERDSLTVVVTVPDTGDAETVILYETTRNSAIFLYFGTRANYTGAADHC